MNFLSSQGGERVKRPLVMGFLNQLFKHRESTEQLPGAMDAVAKAENEVVLDVAATVVTPGENPFLHPKEPPTRVQPPVIHPPRGIGAVVRNIASSRVEPHVPEVMRLELGDILSRVPEQFVRPGNHDLHHALFFDGREVAAELAHGRVEIPLSRIAEQCPQAFFISAYSASTVLVRLPLQKLVEQMGNSPASLPEPEPAKVVEVPIVPKMEEPVLPVVEKVEPPPVVVEQKPVSAANDALVMGPLRVQVHASVSDPLQATLRPMILGATVPPPEISPAHAAGSESVVVPPPPVRLISIQPPQIRPVNLAPVVQAAAPQPAPALPLPVAQSVAPVVISQPTLPKCLPRFESLQAIFMTDEPLDLAAVARYVAALPGVKACQLSSAGERVTGGIFPAGFDEDNLQSLAPELAASADDAASRIHIGDVQNVTLHSAAQSVSIFSRDQVVLGVVLGRRGFVPGVRERLAQAVDALAAPTI